MSLLLIVVVVVDVVFVEIIVFVLHNIRRPLQVCWSCRCGASGDAGSPASPRIHSAGNQDIAENSFYTVHLPIIPVLDESAYIQCPGMEVSPSCHLVKLWSKLLLFWIILASIARLTGSRIFSRSTETYIVSLSSEGLNVTLFGVFVIKWWMTQVG